MNLITAVKRIETERENHYEAGTRAPDVVFRKKGNSREFHDFGQYGLARAWRRHESTRNWCWTHWTPTVSDLLASYEIVTRDEAEKVG